MLRRKAALSKDWDGSCGVSGYPTSLPWSSEGLVRAGPEEATKMTGTLTLRKAERVGGVQPGEEKAPTETLLPSST